MAVRSLGEGGLGSGVRVAALQLGLRWEERGYHVSISSGQDEAAAADERTHHEVLLGTLRSVASVSPELQESAWASWGLGLQAGSLVTPDGSVWPRESSVLGLTFTEGQRGHVSGRLEHVGMQEDVVGSSKLTTLLLAPPDDQAQTVAALRALALDAPSVSPRVILWSGGVRVYEAELDEHGYGTQRVQAYSGASESPVPSSSYADLVDTALRFQTAIHNLGDRVEPVAAVEVAELQSIEPFTRDGSMQRCGWYDAARHRLVVVPGLAASVDDAMEDFLEAELLRTFGVPASPWLMRGLIYVFTGRVGGFSLIEVEPWNEAVTLEDVISPTRQRTRLALAPVEARLARGVLSVFNSDVRAAWGARLEDDEEMLGRLRAQLRTGLLKAPVVLSDREPRAWSGGVVVEVTAPVHGSGRLGSDELHQDLERIASLGFSGVQLTVHVPVAPPSPLERKRVPLGLRGWGYGVTLEGDGALLVSAAAARAQGLSVVLRPRFVTSAAAGLGSAQIHGTPERIRLYGDRRALAMEGLAWLAEQAGVEAIMMFDPEELPRAIGADDPPYRRIAENARTSLLASSTRYASPFTGERIAFCRNTLAMGHSIASPELSVAGVAAGAAAGAEPGNLPTTAIGLELVSTAGDTARLRGRRVMAATQVAEGELRALRIPDLGPFPTDGEEPVWSALSLLRQGAQQMDPSEPGAVSMPHAVLLSPWRLRAPHASPPGESNAAADGPFNMRDFSDERLRGLAAVPR